MAVVRVVPGAGGGGIDQLMLCRRLGGGRGKGNIGRWVVVTARAFKLILFQHSTLILDNILYSMNKQEVILCRTIFLLSVCY